MPATYIVFDLLEVDGGSLLRSPHSARRAVLEALSLNADCCVTQTTFTDGQGLFRAVCEWDLEGIVAKRAASTYRPGLRGWVKVKNPGYWRRDQELAALRRSLERRAATASS